jgi:hypothetical protein
VVAPVPGGKYAVAYTDFNGDGDELGVSLRLVDPAHPPTGIPTHANTTTTFSQYDADLIATPSGLVAAWLDDSDPATAPDIKYRTFGFDLTPTSSEQLLSNAVANEGDVTLAPWGSGWAIAWRAGENGLETLRIQSGSTQWSVGPFLPGPVGARPGLVELDATHLLVVYTEGIDPADTGVANASKLRAAVLDLNAPTTVTPFDIPSSLPGRAGLSQDQPNAMRAGGQVFIAWRTETALASAAGEELWLKEIGWNGTSIDLERGELQLPRLPNSPPGDQRHPGLAAGPLSQNGEQLVAAFDDLGKLFGAEEGQGDIVVEAIPIPLVRLADEP